MQNRPICGRKRELKRFHDIRTADEPAFVAVYGRRRVGKTFLVRQAFHDTLVFELTGMRDGTLTEQLANFTLALSRASAGAFPVEGVPASWQAAFRELSQWCETLPRNQKYVLFFDEFPWLASPRSRFLQALDHFWNAWGTRQNNLILVVCGSAASWMIRRVVHDRGGLHNRVTHRVRLLPFDLAESREFLQSRRVRLTDFQIIELCMALGGVPLYLEQAQPGESAAQVIDRVCFAEDGLLHDEFSQLYPALFDSPERHIAIVRALASKSCGLTRNDLAAATGQPTSGRLTAILEELVESGFVCRREPYGRRVKDTLFRLSDEYSLFYLRWIEKWRGDPSGGWLKVRGTPRWRAWSGLAFESLCLKHVGRIKAALGIAGVSTDVAAWRYAPTDGGDEGAQIDLLIDRADACINLCEMKFSEAEFVIDRPYARRLRERRETFRRVTGTTKNVFLTFVTTHGVKSNPAALELVDSQVSMEALFAPE